LIAKQKEKLYIFYIKEIFHITIGFMMSQKQVVIGAVDRHVAQRVQLRRVMLGMTQSDLAKRCGISFQQIQKYETAGNRIPASRLFDISQALETSVAFFFSGLPGNFPPETKANRSMRVCEPSDNDPLAKNESLQLIKLYWDLPNDDQRAMVMKMLKTLTGND
jgi:transcriptional regulator with XRE-family HTH domain